MNYVGSRCRMKDQIRTAIFVCDKTIEVVARKSEVIKLMYELQNIHGFCSVTSNLDNLCELLEISVDAYGHLATKQYFKAYSPNFHKYILDFLLNLA